MYSRHSALLKIVTTGMFLGIGANAFAAGTSIGPSSRYDLADLDQSVRPGDDFDAFASGGWRARTEIPADQQETGTIDTIVDRTQLQVRKLIETAATSNATPQSRVMAKLYSAFMDQASVEAVGDAPLRANLAVVRGLTDKEAMARFMGGVQQGFGKSFFYCDVWLDLKDPTRNVLRLGQDGLGMRVREAYLGDAAKSAVAAYRDYVVRTLTLIGWPDPNAFGDKIVTMELHIADASWSMAENGDRIKRYTPTTVAGLQKAAPGFPWAAYFSGMGLSNLDRLIAKQVTAFPKLAAIFADTPLETLKAWEVFQVTDSASLYLSRRFVQNRFDFREKFENGLKEQPPRWKIGVDLVNDSLADAVGHEYVSRYLSPAQQAKVEAMVKNFKTAFKTRIERLSWMKPETKVGAIDKLSRVRVFIGHPAHWRDYSALQLDPATLYDDVVKAKAFDWAWARAKLSHPADPDEWALPAQAVDAFSDQSRVAFGITAGILQAPLLDADGDDALNYGGIGEAIGHEMTHQFDDQGRKYDATGAIGDWWTPDDAQRFEQEAAKLAAQYNAFEVLPGLHINGAQTLSENIADLGGLLLALDAYHLSLHGKKAPMIDGMSGDQRLFLAWARVFRTKERAESLRQQAAEGSHTTFRFRALGPARNVDGWYEAFGVRPADHYYVPPRQRVHVW